MDIILLIKGGVIMSYKEIKEKIKNNEFTVNHRTRPNASNSKENNLKNQNTHIKSLYKDEINIIEEGFNNI